MAKLNEAETRAAAKQWLQTDKGKHFFAHMRLEGVPVSLLEYIVYRYFAWESDPQRVENYIFTHLVNAEDKARTLGSWEHLYGSYKRGL